MRLLMVTPQFPPDVGGIQTFSFKIANALHARCDHFAVVAPAQEGQERIDAALPFQVHRAAEWGDQFFLSGVVPVARIARQGRFDTAFCTHWCGAHATIHSPLGWPKRVVCSAHGNEIVSKPVGRFPPAQAVYDRIRSRVFRKADAVTAVSSFTAGLVHRHAGVPEERIRVIASGVDPEIFRPVDAAAVRDRIAPAGERLILTVARLVPRKGVDRVIEALATIAVSIPDVRYVIVGDGPQRSNLERLARDCGVADRIVWAGRVGESELVALYNACDLFVMPASSELPDVEGFGLVYLEAGACGKPVIGSTSGGIPDAVVEGETGLLVDVGDRDGLARGVVRILADAELAQRMGAAGRKRAATLFNWDAIGDRLMRVLDAA